MESRQTDTPDVTRRNLLRSAALGAVSVPVLVACGDGGGSNAEGGSSPSSPSGGGGSGVLAKTSDIKVGGAVFLDPEGPNVVITQPSAGDFHAFDRTCTHMQCPVSDIQDGKIHCNCHGSLYDMTTGENVGGPAPKPLTKVDITVKNGQVLKA